MKIYDAHSHYMPPEVAQNTAFFKVNWSDIERQLKLMDEGGVEQSLLLYPTSDAHLNMGGWKKLAEVYNQKISDVAERYKDRFVGAGILPLDFPTGIALECQRIKDLGLKAFSLASSCNGKYLDDEMFFPVYEFAEKNNMPIHVHAQIMNPIGEERVKDPLLSPVLEYVFDVSICIGKMMMSGVFAKYSKVKFIFAHYGGVLPLVRERFDSTYSMLRGRGFVKDLGQLPSEFFKNVYFDMSGSKSVASLLCALEMVDSSHILWGSDFPANQNLTAVNEIMSKTPLNAEDKSNIVKNNFMNLFFG
jgi:predicted TIM-barrel fold metal-dependent hydrolase